MIFATDLQRYWCKFLKVIAEPLQSFNEISKVVAEPWLNICEGYESLPPNNNNNDLATGFN